MNVALLIIFAFAALALGLGLRASHGKDMNLEQWTVAGRGFGAIFVFLLMAGEIYTTFTFLGGSGWAYGKGAPTYYILCYGSLAFILSYWLLPPIWRYARAHHLISQPHYFTHVYNSPLLGGLVALVGIVALIPYMVLQLKGLGIIVSTSSYGSISPTIAIFIGAAIVTAYVMVSGVHGSAWNAVIKDTMILLIVVFLGVYLPLRLYGGYGAMFTAIDEAKPGFLALPERGQSVLWFSSSVLLSALGFYMWPHAFGALFTARDASAFRKNAIVMPLYQLILLFVFFVGFAAVLKVPGLTGGEVDLALFRISIQTFDPWFVGVIGGAGVLTALVPGSLILDGRRHAVRQRSPGAADRHNQYRSDRAYRATVRPGLGSHRRMVCDRRRPNHRGAALDGLCLRHATLSRIDREPHAAQSGQPRRRVCRHRRRRRHGVADDLAAPDPDESPAVSAAGS